VAAVGQVQSRGDTPELPVVLAFVGTEKNTRFQAKSRKQRAEIFLPRRSMVLKVVAGKLKHEVKQKRAGSGSGSKLGISGAGF
jgi:hypothetical protein